MRRLIDTKPAISFSYKHILFKDHVTAIWRASAGVKRAENVSDGDISRCIVLEFGLAGWLDGLIALLLVLVDIPHAC